MRFERVFEDGNGQTFRAVMEIDESGPKLEAAIQRLATKASSSMHQKRLTAGEVTALDGAIRVQVTKVFAYRCMACDAHLTYDSQLPEYRLNHRRETAGPCEGTLQLVTGGSEA